MYSLTLLLLCAGAALASTIPKNKPKYSLEDAEVLFEDYMKTYKKVYPDENEKSKRFEIFKKTLEEINLMNSDPEETAYFDINEFADLGQEEFKKLYGSCVMPPNELPLMNETVEIPVDIKLDSGFDWRQYRAVTGVKSQGIQCGSCWAFSAIGTLEGAYAIKHGNPVSFSEQQLLDCSGAGNCGGGHPYKALQYLVQVGGAVTEINYPYTAVQSQCRLNIQQIQARVTGMSYASMISEDALAQQLKAYGPISIGLDSKSFYHNYSGGVFRRCTLQSIDHAMLLVGYGTEPDGTQYWIIKNSYGPNWGEGGYIRLLRGVNACGMMNYPGSIAQVA